MANTMIVTTRIDPALGERLDAVAQAYDRSRGWIVARAIERYVAEEAALLDAIRQGEADIAAGRTRSQDEVEAMFNVARDRRDAA